MVWRVPPVLQIRRVSIAKSGDAGEKSGGRGRRVSSQPHNYPAECEGAPPGHTLSPSPSTRRLHLSHPKQIYFPGISQWKPCISLRKSTLRWQGGWQAGRTA